MNNPLVAEAQSSTAWYSGAGILDTIFTTVDYAGKEDWVGTGLGVAAAGVDALAILADPFGALLSAGFGWVMEHVSPLKEMLDTLAGSPDVINSYAATWKNVSGAVSAAADHFEQIVTQDSAAWKGPAISAYQLFVENEIKLIRGAGMAADGISTVVTIAGVIVATVRCIVRDLIAEFCAKVTSYLIEEAATLGLATPLVIVQISTAAAKWGAKIIKWLERLGDVLRRLGGVMEKLAPVVDDLIKALTKCGYAERAPHKLPTLADAATLKSTVTKEATKYGSDKAHGAGFY